MGIGKLTEPSFSEDEDMDTEVAKRQNKCERKTE